MDLPPPPAAPAPPSESTACSPPSAHAAPVYELRAPDRQTAPLVLTSPHSGRDYSPAFLAAARLDSTSLRRSEDCYVDDLFAAAPDLGAPLLAARFPRAWCDPNREAWELDPAMFEDLLPEWVNTASPRVGVGLGTIARIVASGETIYRGKLRFAEAEARVRTCWEPFHAALAGLIAGTRARFGRCVLLDCHSMPATMALGRVGGRGPADIVLGDAHGTACSPRTIRIAEQVLESMGYRVRRNDPYAGGYITRHYGRPREGVEALQIELCRSLYMDEAALQKSAAFAAVRRDMESLISALLTA
jgi:N-formylglutamate amidohydrolase